MLAAHSIPAPVLTALVRTGLATAKKESVIDDELTIEVTRVWITEAGQGLLAARGT
jgi:hypothetical protein